MNDFIMRIQILLRVNQCIKIIYDRIKAGDVSAGMPIFISEARGRQVEFAIGATTDKKHFLSPAKGDGCGFILVDLNDLAE